jgi:hypothetical protein
MKTPTFGRSCPIRPEQGARRSLVQRQPTKTGRSRRSGPVTGPERSGKAGVRHAAPGAGRRRTSAAAGSEGRSLAQAWRRKPAAVAPDCWVMFGHGLPGCPKILYGPVISREKAAIFALDDVPLGNGVATWSVAGAAKQLKVSGLTTRPWLKRPRPADH